MLNTLRMSRVSSCYDLEESQVHLMQQFEVKNSTFINEMRFLVLLEAKIKNKNILAVYANMFGHHS